MGQKFRIPFLVLSLVLAATGLFTLFKIAFAAPKTFSSHNIVLQSDSPNAYVQDNSETTTATIEFYESSNDDGVDNGVPFDVFGTSHPDAFNDVSTSLRQTSSPNGNYPYVGKSSTSRGSTPGESNTPEPTDVFDLQMHTPDNDHLTVASFIVPEDGEYTVSDLAVRGVLPWSSGATFKVFDNTKTLISSLTTTGQTWVTDETAYDLGALSAGDRIYFAVDRDADFIGDAVEINWSVERIIPEPTQLSWDSYNTEISSASAQATITNSLGLTPAVLDLYESVSASEVDLGLMLSIYTLGNHQGEFNNLTSFRRTEGDGYPYIGKSSTPRGTDSGESNIPEPTGVFDLQMHPPANGHLIVAAFTAPLDGEYSISNLGVRRVLPWGTSVTLKIFNNNKEEVASLTSLGLSWTTDSETFNLGTLSAGDKIYIAVDGNEDFVGDASEVTFRITNTR